MTGARPGGEEQEEARVGMGRDFMAFSGLEVDQHPWLSFDRFRVGADVHIAIDDDQPNPLMDLVLLEGLPDGKVDDDRASLVGRGEDLRRVLPPR